MSSPLNCLPFDSYLYLSSSAVHSSLSPFYSQHHAALRAFVARYRSHPSLPANPPTVDSPLSPSFGSFSVLPSSLFFDCISYLSVPDLITSIAPLNFLYFLTAATNRSLWSRSHLSIEGNLSSFARRYSHQSPPVFDYPAQYNGPHYNRPNNNMQFFKIPLQFLTSLAIEGNPCDLVRNLFLTKDLAVCCPELRSLRLVGMQESRVSIQSAIIPLTKALPNLTALTISAIGDSVEFAAALNAFPKLRFLEILQIPTNFLAILGEQKPLADRLEVLRFDRGYGWYELYESMRLFPNLIGFTTLHPSLAQNSDYFLPQYDQHAHLCYHAFRPGVKAAFFEAVKEELMNQSSRQRAQQRQQDHQYYNQQQYRQNRAYYVTHPGQEEKEGNFYEEQSPNAGNNSDIDSDGFPDD